MSSSGRVRVTEIPRDIREQEHEIELMVRFGNSASLPTLHGSSDVALEQEATVWVLIVLLVLICMGGSYLFWLKII